MSKSIDRKKQAENLKGNLEQFFEDLKAKEKARDPDIQRKFLQGDFNTKGPSKVLVVHGRTIGKTLAAKMFAKEMESNGLEVKHVTIDEVSEVKPEQLNDIKTSKLYL